MQKRDVSIGRFLLRRAFKIYPSFWFFLAAMLALAAVQHRAIEWREVLGELFFVQNYWANWFNHTWSLAVEEHFYLMCAGGVWLLLKMRKDPAKNPFRSIPLVFLLLAALCLAVRLVSNRVYPPSHVRLIFFCTHIRVDSLFFGVLLSYLWHFHFTAERQQFLRRHRWLLALLGVALLTPMFFVAPFGAATWVRVYGFVLCYLAGGALLFGFLKIFEGVSSPVPRFLGYLGVNSYSTYLWHPLGIGFAASCFAQRQYDAGEWIGYCLLSNAFAWLLGIGAARLVEFPVLRLRDRWFPSLVSPVAQKRI